MHFRLVLLLTLPFSALLLGIGVGCGDNKPPTYPVTGKLLYKGEPIKAKEINGQKVGRVKLWFLQQDVSSADPKQATVDANGSFSLQPDEQVPKGKYKVCVTWQDSYPSGPDRLQGKYNEKNSKIVRDLPTPNGAPLELELTKEN